MEKVEDKFIKNLTNKSLLLIEASHSLYDEYYIIRSEKNNLFWTGYENPPDYKLFKEWFKQRINDPDRYLYLLYSNDNCIGSLNIDYYAKYAIIGYSVKKKFEGKGFGTFLVKEAIKIIKLSKDIRKQIYQVKALIFEKNNRSIKLIEKIGFKFSGNYEIKERFGKEEQYLEYTLEV